MIESLSVKVAQKLVLNSQQLPPVKLSPANRASATDATLSAIEHLGYIQIDTISAVQRAHHHTLWNRNPRYKTDQLDELVADKKVFEHWSHAAAFLPMCDYRFSLRYKEAIASGEQKHWFTPNTRLMKEVMNRIATEGPLMAKDFDGLGKSLGDWKTKPTKQALECLFIQGDLMISSRRNFHKVYDLTERVLPAHLDTTTPTLQEHTKFLITSYLRANGLGQASEIGYLLKNKKALITATANEMVDSGELIQLRVVDKVYYALPHYQDELDKPLSRSKLKILSPFDNLLIQRKRMSALFNFDYTIECYTPAAKRKYGYFSLPILWDGKLVARMDCKAERKDRLLRINHLALEPSLTKTEAFAPALSKELGAFLKFNECDTVRLDKVSPVGMKSVFENLL